MSNSIFSDNHIDLIQATVEIETEFMFSDWDDGIGSSDISAVVANVIRSLTGIDIFSSGEAWDSIDPTERWMIRNAVQNALSKLKQ